MDDLEIPVAEVLWWNHENVRVRCPYCGKGHRHGIDYEKRYQAYLCERVAHCGAAPEITGNPKGSYRFIYPFSAQGKVAFEIDKQRARFVNVGVQQEAESEPQRPMGELDGFLQRTDATDSDELAEEMERKLKLAGYRTFSEATRTYDVPLPIGESMQLPLIDKVISNCILGEVMAVKTYLNTASADEQDILLHGKDDKTNGRTALIYAATEQSSRHYEDTMVSLLLKRGAEVNATNFDGRTALMEAALWGRADNARLLLKAGADKDMIDGDGNKAVDLASPSDRNEDERYIRSGSGRVYKEITREANQARRNIVNMLQPVRAGSSSERHPDDVSRQYDHLSSFQYDPNTSSYVYLTAKKALPVKHESKTVARLERGHPFESIFAKSGWSSNETATVNGRQLTDEVFELAELLGYQLPANAQCDQGRPGQFSACHAEKQLLACLISRHRFGEAEIEESEELKKLCQAQPPVELRKAKLLVSRPVCTDCKAFIKLFEQKASFTIEARC